LKELKDDGILTEEEFETKKEELLNDFWLSCLSPAYT
jgi:hypothetical protein